MAKAGDGASRSQSRRLRDVITLRVSKAEKLQFGRAAQTCGAPSLSAWAMDQMRRGCGGSTRRDRMLAGALGQASARLKELSLAIPTISPAETSQMIAGIAGDLHDLQMGVITNAGESHPQ